MRVRRTVLAALVAAIASILVLPATARSETSFHLQVRGLTAWALFASEDAANPCLFTQAFVFATEEHGHEPPGPPRSGAFAFARITRWDFCAGKVLFHLSGSTTAVQLEGSRALKTATLVTTMTVRDFFSGSTSDVTFDLSWTGNGATTQVVERFHVQEPGLIANFRSNDVSREATVVGTISDGATDFTAGTTAEMGQVGWFNAALLELAVG